MGFCKHCGTQLKEGTKFCHKCGKPVDAESEDKERKHPYSYNGSEHKGFKKRNHPSILIAMTVIGLVVLAILFYVIVGGDKENNGKVDSENENPINAEKATPPDFANEKDYQSFLEKKKKIERIDADEYFEKNSEIVKDVIASESKSIYSEKNIFEELRERGFTDYPITSDYEIDGDFIERKEISESSEEVHPVYQTSYMDRNGEVWCIYVVNDAILANPLSYNLKSGSDVQVIVSERDTVTSYDSDKNKFYETIPNDSVLIVKIIDRLDSRTLDELVFSENEEK